VNLAEVAGASGGWSRSAVPRPVFIGAFDHLTRNASRNRAYQAVTGGYVPSTTRQAVRRHINIGSFALLTRQPIGIIGRNECRFQKQRVFGWCFWKTRRQGAVREPSGSRQVADHVALRQERIAADVEKKCGDGRVNFGMATKSLQSSGYDV
jgi:hypothetical protein